MKPSQEVMNYLRGRNGTGPFWNADCQTDPKERILSNAYNELLNELRNTAKSAAVMRTLGEAAKKLLGI